MATTKKKPPKQLTLTQQAQALVEAGLGPQRTAIQEAIAAAEADRLALAKATEGTVKAVGALSAGDAAAARDAYAGAADRIGGLGSALTGAVREAIQRETPNAALIRTIGAPGSVPNGADSVVNTASMLGTVIPGTGLANEAARALVNMGDRRFAAGVRLADASDSALFKGKGDIDKMRASIRDLEAKRPGLLLEAVMNLRQQANQERATKVQIGTLQLQQAKTAQEQAVAMTNLTGTIHIVKGGKVVDTGRAAPGSDAGEAATRAATATATAAASAAAKKEAARIAAESKREAAEIAAAAKINAAKIAARKKETTNAKTRLDAETKFRTNGKTTALELMGYNKDLGRPLKFPPKRVTLMNAIYNTYGAALVGKFGITENAVRAWARQIVMAFPNRWWQKSTYGGGGSTGGGETA